MGQHDIDLREVIKKTASEVQLSELERKGFKRVKVLDKEAVRQMISDAVEEVVARRLVEASDRDRDLIRTEARQEFQNKMAEFQASQAERVEQVSSRERELGELEAALAHQKQEAAALEAQLRDQQQELERARGEILSQREEITAQRQEITAQSQEIVRQRAEIAEAQSQLEDAERKLLARDAELVATASSLEAREAQLREQRTQSQNALEGENARLVERERELRERFEALQQREAELQAEGANNNDLADLKASIADLAKLVQSGGGFAGGRGGTHDTSAAATVEAMLLSAEQGAEQVENNLGKVKVQNKQARGVNSTLEKLKNMKKNS